MPLDIKQKFSDRVALFFRLRRVELGPFPLKDFIHYLYQQFESQGRLRDPEKPFYLTPRFMMNAISNFLDIKHSHTLALFRDHRFRRSLAVYRHVDSADSFHSGGSTGLIHRLGRGHKPEYKLTKPSGLPVTPQKNIRNRMSMFHVGYSPLEPDVSANKPRRRATAADGSSYEMDMVSDQLALWRRQTPNKGGSPYRVALSLAPIEDSQEFTDSYDAESKKDTTECFEFCVTKADVLDRIGAKRGISQKRVMGDVSAFDLMKAIGMIVTEKQSGREFHWAHRQGWSLHGEQKKDNFDPTTAGSNYDTLFKVEAPLKKILFEHGIDKVLVKGEVVFDKDNGLPFRISYHLSWGVAGEFVTVIIDPMSHRVPTTDEHDMATHFLEMALQPRF